MNEAILRTQRTYLKEFTNSDIDSLASLLADPEVMRFSMTGPMTKEETQKLLRSWIENYKIAINSPWAIIYEEQLIGFAGFDVRIVEEQEKRQITFRLMRDYWGKGLATELAKALKDYAFSKLMLNEFIAIVDPNNLASIRTLEKIGMVYDKTINYEGLDRRIFSLHLFTLMP